MPPCKRNSCFGGDNGCFGGSEMPDPITVVMGENNGFLGGDCAIVMGALRVSGALLELWGKPLVKGSKGAITVVVGALLVVMGALLELWERYWSFGGVI